MSLYGGLTGLVPHSAELVTYLYHILKATLKIISLFNDGAPRRPHTGYAFASFQYPAKCTHIFKMKTLVKSLIHVIGICSPLGVYIEHYKGVVSVAESDSLHGFERIVKVVGFGS